MIHGTSQAAVRVSIVREAVPLFQRLARAGIGLGAQDRLCLAPVATRRATVCSGCGGGEAAKGRGGGYIQRPRSAAFFRDAAFGWSVAGG